MDFDKVLEKRRSIRNYSTKKVAFKDVIAICEAALLAPMAGNIFTIKIILVSDKKKRQELSGAALEQEFIAEAPCVLVVCSDTSQLVKSYGKRAEIYARQQTGAAIENMFLKATSLGLAMCWVGAFDENAIKDSLGIPNGIQVEALLPIAYAREKEKIKPRVRPQLKQILNFEKWGIKTTKPGRRASPF